MKVATRSTLEQIAIIDGMLARPSGATVRQMADRMGCCTKTVRRHVAWMCRKFDLRVVRVGFDCGDDRRWVYPIGQSSIFTNEALRRLA